MEKYYRILKIRRGATQIEIRNAYRKLAKKLHPDVNDSPTAKEDFIELNEAYEFLTDPEVRKKVRFKATPKARRTTRTAQHQQWNKQKREKAREKAKVYARQKHADFLRKQAEGNPNSAKKLLGVYFFLYSMTVILPVIGGVMPTEDYTFTQRVTSDGFLWFTILWCAPFSIIIGRAARKEIKIIKFHKKK